MEAEIVFFDAGETLLHPHPSFAELFARICRDNGYDVGDNDVSIIQERLAPHLVDLAEEAGLEGSLTLSPVESKQFWTYLYRRFLAELGIEDDALAERLYSVFSDISTYRLFDDVLPVLADLSSRGHRLGLISNFEGWLEKVLVELEVGHLFDTSVISGVEGVEKPDPAIYRLALERAGVPAERALHIGDSIRLDIEPAQAVGIIPVLLDRAGRYGPVDCLRIDSLSELPSLLDSLAEEKESQS